MKPSHTDYQLSQFLFNRSELAMKERSSKRTINMIPYVYMSRFEFFAFVRPKLNHFEVATQMSLSKKNCFFSVCVWVSLFFWHTIIIIIVIGHNAHLSYVNIKTINTYWVRPLRRHLERTTVCAHYYQYIPKFLEF